MKLVVNGREVDFPTDAGPVAPPAGTAPGRTSRRGRT